MTEWREELIEAIAKAAWESDGTREWKRVNEPFRKFWLRNIRTALAIAEPVIATGFREGVAVIGGIGLSGGKGGVRNVIIGTALIGILLNGMTILNTPYTVQNIIKSIILMLAIVADSILNPRDEQTSQQGDI